MVVFPNAKINLGLNVMEKREDGFHNLVTVFFPVGLCDVLEVIESKKFNFQTSGIPINSPPQENLVFKAYKLLKSTYKLPPVFIHLHKNIPFGAGLGGGSADAAFMLKLLNELFQLKIEDNILENFASKLGADCAFFIKNIPSAAYGKGEILTPINLNLSDYTIIIVKPPFSVNTANAYQAIKPCVSTFNLKEITSLPVEKWKEKIKNDFELPVFELHPEIKNIKQTLYQNGAIYSAMSGSGSAVFGIFRNSPTNIENSFPDSYFIYR